MILLRKIYFMRAPRAKHHNIEKIGFIDRLRRSRRERLWSAHILRATPHKESCGALRKFRALTLFRFHGNTSSVAAKPRLVSTKNLLANRFCPIMRYCLKLRKFAIEIREQAACSVVTQHIRPLFRLISLYGGKGVLVNKERGIAGVFGQFRFASGRPFPGVRIVPFRVPDCL